MKIALVVIGFIILASGLAFAQSAGKIGIVDLQRVIRDSQAGKTAKAAFEREFQDKRRIIEQKTEQLSRMKQDFIRTRDDFRDELQKRDFELTQKILSELEGVIQKIGDSDGYVIIIEKTEGGVIYAAKGVDLTDKIIQAYDSTRGSSKK